MCDIMEMRLVTDDVGEFTSASSSDADTDGDNDTGRKLKLAHMIAAVDPPSTPRTKELRALRKLRPPSETNIFYTVQASDLQVDKAVFVEVDGKLLSDADIDALFVRDGSMMQLLQKARRENSYIVALYRQVEEDSIGLIQVTASVYEILHILDIGFGMVIHFPDGSIKRVPLGWSRAFDDTDVVLRYDGDDSDTQIVVVSHNEDDLLIFDICFMSHDVFVEDFIVMHASMSIGTFGAAVEINRGRINEALARIFRETHGMPWTIFSAVDHNISELIGMEIEGPSTRPGGDEMYSLADRGEGSSSRHASHYDRRTTLRMDEVMRRNAVVNMKPMSTGYQTTEGWFRVTPKRNLNESIKYRAGVMSATIRVNVDDSIYNTMRNIYTTKKEELRERSFRHVKKSQKAIIQQSYPASHHDYMTSDETYLETIDHYKKQHAQAVFTPAAILRASFLTIYRHRCIFDAGAVPNIIIPTDVMQHFQCADVQDQLAIDRRTVDQCVADGVIDAILEEEQLAGIPRNVSLKNWGLKCPAEFVEDALRQMLDADLCGDTWSIHRKEYEIAQRANATTRRDDKVSFWRRFVMWGITGFCSTGK